MTPDQAAWRDRARAFAHDRVAPLARQADEAGRFPIELVPAMGRAGFLGGPIAPALGGAGMDHRALALVYEELGYVDSSVRGFMAVHTGLVTLCLADHGRPDQQAEWLPRLARGEAIGCYALTEDEAGSDAAAMRTTARRDGDHYVLDGRKIWITNGGIADVALVFARDPSLPAERPHRQICAFVVPTDTPGLVCTPLPWRTLGHRAADHAVLTFDGCRVPASARLGAPGGGFRVAMGALDHGRLGVAAGAVGVGRACLDASVAFARQRRAFGSRIGDFGMIQQALADMYADLEAAALLVAHAAELKMAGAPSTRATATAKLFAVEAALRAADQAVLIHGGRGYGNDVAVERHWRDIKGLQIYEGTSHIQRLIIARDLLGPDTGASETLPPPEER